MQTTAILDKTHERSTEQALLGSMLFCPDEVIPELSVTLPAECFHYPEHQKIYLSIATVYLSGKVDSVLLRNELQRQGQLDAVGGVQYLVDVMESVPGAANWRYYRDELLDQHAARQVEAALRKMQDIHEEPGGVADKIREIQEVALSIESPSTESPYVDFSTEIISVADSIGEQEELLETGWRNLDALIHGFLRGELVVVAGRTREGKSTFAMQVGLNVARSGSGVFVVSLEMPPVSIMQRIICGKSDVDLHQISSGFVTPTEIESYKKAASDLACEGINLTFSRLGRGSTPEQVAVMVRQLKKTKDIKLVVIDYLQLMTGKGGTLRERIVDITKRLKQLAMREDIVVLLLSQLKRSDDAKHKPQLSDLKESGSIEQDADLCLMLYRENLLDDKSDGGLTKVFVRKNRRGPGGCCDLVFVGRYCRFENSTVYPGTGQ